MIIFANRKYASILAEYQLISSKPTFILEYYIDYELKEGEVYCEVERPIYLPIIIQKFMSSEMSAEDELEQAMLIDFGRWLVSYNLT